MRKTVKPVVVGDGTQVGAPVINIRPDQPLATFIIRDIPADGMFLGGELS
jgi:hypothetical protein